MKRHFLKTAPLAIAIVIGATVGGCGSDDDNAPASSGGGSTGQTTGTSSTGSSPTGGDAGGSTSSTGTTSGASAGGSDGGKGTTGGASDGGKTTGASDGGADGGKGTGGVSDGGADAGKGTTGGEGGAGPTSGGEGGAHEAGSEEGGDAGLTFAAVQAIFNRCTPCHTSTRPDGGARTPSGNLDMTTNGVVAALVDVQAGFCADRKYVAPGDPANSYVISAVTGNFPVTTDTCTNNNVDGGTPMFQMPPKCVPVEEDGGPVDAAAAGDGGPITNPCLTSSQVQLLMDWIRDGAKQ